MLVLRPSMIDLQFILSFFFSFSLVFLLWVVLFLLYKIQDAVTKCIQWGPFGGHAVCSSVPRKYWSNGNLVDSCTRILCIIARVVRRQRRGRVFLKSTIASVLIQCVSSVYEAIRSNLIDVFQCCTKLCACEFHTRICAIIRHNWQPSVLPRI